MASSTGVKVTIHQLIIIVNLKSLFFTLYMKIPYIEYHPSTKDDIYN